MRFKGIKIDYKRGMELKATLQLDAEPLSNWY